MFTGNKEKNTSSAKAIRISSSVSKRRDIFDFKPSTALKSRNSPQMKCENDVYNNNRLKTKEIFLCWLHTTQPRQHEFSNLEMFLSKCKNIRAISGSYIDCMIKCLSVMPSALKVTGIISYSQERYNDSLTQLDKWICEHSKKQERTDIEIIILCLYSLFYPTHVAIDSKMLFNKLGQFTQCATNLRVFATTHLGSFAFPLLKSLPRSLRSVLLVCGAGPNSLSTNDLHENVLNGKLLKEKFPLLWEFGVTFYRKSENNFDFELEFLVEVLKEVSQIKSLKQMSIDLKINQILFDQDERGDVKRFESALKLAEISFSSPIRIVVNNQKLLACLKDNLGKHVQPNVCWASARFRNPFLSEEFDEVYPGFYGAFPVVNSSYSFVVNADCG